MTQTAMAAHAYAAVGWRLLRMPALEEAIHA